MLVRDAGDFWALVSQPDHGDLCGELAALWGGSGFSTPSRALRLAAERHDDGWAAWERRPQVAADSRPVGFTDAEIVPLLSCYRASVDLVGGEDAHAGLLVSMHVSGLRRGRYGRGPDDAAGEERGAAGTPPEGEDPRVTRFVAEEEARGNALAEELGVAELELWHEYALLQVFDLLSLHIGLCDLDRPSARILARVPTSAGEPPRAVAVEASGPRALRLSPSPFTRGPARVTLRRRVVRKRQWPDSAAFASDLAGADPELIDVTLT